MTSLHFPRVKFIHSTGYLNASIVSNNIHETGSYRIRLIATKKGRQRKSTRVENFRERAQKCRLRLLKFTSSHNFVVIVFFRKKFRFINLKPVVIIHSKFCQNTDSARKLVADQSCSARVCPLAAKKRKKRYHTVRCHTLTLCAQIDHLIYIIQPKSIFMNRQGKLSFLRTLLFFFPFKTLRKCHTCRYITEYAHMKGPIHPSILSALGTIARPYRLQWHHAACIVHKRE